MTAVRNLPFDAEFTARNGPAAIDRRSKPSGLTELSAGFLEFTETGATEPWTLPYEEVLYVIEGELTLTHEGTDIVAKTGDLVTLEKGATVVYAGTQGTRLLFSLVPANWLESQE
ncbi:MAG: DUF861 domain-containing protein [Nocardioidaceae bacterium]|nr:DUF861 domain-containing protein [Nocardioidaceae bacterium]